MGVTTKHALIKAYTAGAAVSKRRIVKMGAADGAVIQAAAGTDLLIGVSLDLDAASGERVDTVIANGIVEVDAAGTITRGQGVTADADGKAVAAAAGDYAIGDAEVSAVAGDVMTVILNKYQLDKDVS